MFTFIASNNPIHHILDKPISGVEHITLLGKPVFTTHMASLLLAAIVTFVVLKIAAKRIAIGHESEGTSRYLTNGRIPQIIEVVAQDKREEERINELGENNQSP